jgi:hypothetical protein
MNHLISITKSDGTRQLFEEEKLIGSLRRVGATDIAIDEIVEQVESEMKDGMETNAIYNRAFELLKKHSLPVAIKYSVRRALVDLGPDGFPFEKFVARIFRAWGYSTLTDQMVPGKCVPHEVDVVAWKDQTLAMVEAKFHNEFGMKSDLKVALYVKARYDDLAMNTFDYGGKDMHLTEKWLITNTKFTDRAIQYGTCNDLKLVGWNYPSNGNLHDIIEDHGLHPISCIASLERSKMHELVSRDILVCADLVKSENVLRDVGIDEIRAAQILNEAKGIING